MWGGGDAREFVINGEKGRGLTSLNGLAREHDSQCDSSLSDSARSRR